MTRPLPVQVALLRRFLGKTQEELARALGLKQTHISRLEKGDSDHLLSLYKRAAGKMGAHLALIPDDMAIIPRSRLRRFAGAHP
ncbi:MAG: helix-turn-helix domain-containing protein [Elusimicrobia bacterium]|nr:helix-turn-helix domain-containing protein [Elusimicrobiota bacterium]